MSSSASIQIDEQLIARALKLGQHRTKKPAVTQALQNYLRCSDRRNILALFWRGQLCARFRLEEVAVEGMRVLVDTSVWSEALRRASQSESQVGQELRSLFAEDRAEMIGPIRQEALSWYKEDSQFEQLEKHLAAFPELCVDRADYVVAAKFFNVSRAKGIQGSNTDLLICAAAVQRQLAVLTTDKDFAPFA